MPERAPRLLERIERAGNALPHPATLFALALLVVMALSQIAAWAGWSVERPAPDGDGTITVTANGLLESDGLWWLLSTMVENFVLFPPLGIVLVAMLGIGVAERSGLLPALIERALRVTPQKLLTPSVVFIGILSSIALDAGYVVLPPLAAALYHAAGRSPLAGLAAAFAGVSAGFSANLFITGLDPLLAGFTQAGAQILDPDYRVAVTANWWLMIVSAFVLTAVGWWVTARFIEPRFAGSALPADTAPAQETQVVADIGADVPRALRAAGIAFAFALAAVLLLILVPGAPLYGQGGHFSRWVEAMVPLLFLVFLAPGLAYGIVAGTIRSDRDAARMMADTLAALAPYVVLAFFAAQFIAAFRYSELGLLLAITGGEWLAALPLPATALVLAFIVIVMAANLVIGSASAKYAFFAPVFVPMLMLAGISPELTQAAYRIGDSITNIVTPLNPYWVIVLAFVQRWRPSAGVGTLLALMIPYSVAFALAWPLLLMLWLLAALPLGPGAALAWP
jgi:aminobenzoyl-glutamate transport protein